MKFEYLKATTVAEATSLIDRYEGRAKVLAGGTDLVVQMRKEVIKPEFVIDISRIKELDYIRFDAKEGLKIGALTTIAALRQSDVVRREYPMLAETAGKLASEGVRTLATLGGNLCNASPSAETAPGLIVLAAVARIAGPRGEREVPVQDFFTGPGKTVLGKGELLVEIAVPPLPPRTGAAYLNLGTRGSMDLSIVGVAVLLTLEKSRDAVQEACIALGAVAPTPMRAFAAEEALRGKVITDAEIKAASSVASGECRPVDDVRSSAEYRCAMVGVYTGYAVREALSRAKSAGTD